MDTLGTITSLYQVIQEYLIFSVGQGLQEIVSLMRSLDTLGKQASIGMLFFLRFAQVFHEVIAAAPICHL